MNKPASIGFRRKPPDHAAAAEQVRAWVRARFALPDEAVVMVAEVTCAVPGCPPLETVVVFWTEGDRRHQFKLFKPVSAVVAEDLPPAWMKNALIALNGMGLECC